MTRDSWIMFGGLLALGLVVWIVSHRISEKNAIEAESAASAAASASALPPPIPEISTAPVVVTPTNKPDAAGVADRALVPEYWAQGLATPRATIETQTSLLVSNHFKDFRSTFLPSVQNDLTDAAIDSCAHTAHSRVIKPDWATATNTTINGQRVTRVSIFGKSMTGFREVSPGKWLADSVWCAPHFP